MYRQGFSDQNGHGTTRKGTELDFLFELVQIGVLTFDEAAKKARFIRTGHDNGTQVACWSLVAVPSAR